MDTGTTTHLIPTIHKNGSCLPQSPSSHQSTLYFSELPEAMTNSLPSCSLTALLEVFDRASHGLYLGSSQSMLSLSFPTLFVSPTMFHSWISCSATVLSLENDYWHRISLEHRTLAIGSLNKAISSKQFAQDQLATMIMLHMSEVRAQYTPTRELYRSYFR